MTFQTQRPTVEALERLMFAETPVLDHGFVRLIDYMGDESAIVQAARVSYGRGTKTESLDEGLIRYLLRARHTTPFEMCEMKLHIKMPIFVARQWIRHRMACLGSQTVIQFDEPAAVNSGSRKRSNATIGELFRLWSQGTKHILPKKKPTYTEQVNPDEIYTIPELSRLVKRREETLRNCIREGHLEAFRVEANSPREPVIRVKGSSWHEYAGRNYEVSIDMKPRIMKRLVRCVNEDTGEVGHTKIVNVWESGEKEVFHVKMENGNWFECSQDHLILTPNGMKKLKELSVGSMAISIVGGNGTNEPFDHEANPESEIWKSVLGWEAYYEVSNHGRVRRIGKGKGARRMKPTKGTLSRGRRVVNLNLPGKQTLRHVAHLVAEAFIGHRPLGLMCCHNDGNSLNNWSDNLRWGTPKSNGEDMVRDGMSSMLASKAVPIASITSIGTQMTYDMEVEGPWHNFSAGGVIVHNSVNEYSARYSILDREFYLPEPEVLAQQSKTNKQGRGKVLTAEEAKQVLALLHRDAMRSYDTYEELLNDQGDGTPKDESLPQVARELARMNLSLNFYTQWYWKIDLHNLMHFLGLRMDAHAQYEIRVYADQIGEMVKAWVPHVWTAFEDYRLGSVSFSRPEMDTLRDFFEGLGAEKVQPAFRASLREKGCSPREIKAFMTILGLAPKE